MTPIQTLYTYLSTLNFEYEPSKFWGGITSTWLAPNGLTQPKPFLQMRLLEEEKVPASERLLLIKNVSAGSGTRFASDPVFVFAIMGKVGEPPAFAETYAELLYAALLEFNTADCIVGIKPMGRIGGPYKTDSSRCVYDMEFMVTVESGVL